MIDEVYRCIEAHAANPVFIHLLPRARVEERLRSIESLPRTLPLWGRSFAVKDNIDVAGLPTTAGCPAYSYIAKVTAPPLQKLLDAAALPLKAVRFAVPRQLEFHGDRAYEAVFGKALARLAELGGRRVDIGFAPFLEAQALLYGPWIAERAAEGFPLEAMLPVTRQIFESGARHSAADLFKAQHRLAELKRDCAGLLASADVLVVPAAPTIYRIAEVEGEPVELNTRLGRYTNFVNLLDLAALALPAGFRPGDGLPFGIALVGPAFSDRALAALGARFTGEGEIPASPRLVKVAVVGAHLSGMPLNHQLTSRGAELVQGALTSPPYRLYTLSSHKHGLVRRHDC